MLNLAKAVSVCQDRLNGFCAQTKSFTVQKALLLLFTVYLAALRLRRRAAFSVFG
jgi:hypothetical protein